MTEATEDDPLARFEAWYAAAEQAEPSDANAMTLATVSAAGIPSARMVLLKGHDARGFVFYTNLGSRKARELGENPNAALCFHWKSLKRQVRIEGAVERVGDAEADAYFASRPRVSQLGAWASKQSQPLRGRFELEGRLAKITARYPLGAVPRPPFWSGFRLVPEAMEFWEEGTFRLHMRFRYVLGESGGWQVQELYP